MPLVREFIRKALIENPNDDVNSLHARTYDLMMRHKRQYYEGKVDSFLAALELPETTKTYLRNEMLKPLEADGVQYSNFMEEASRRISQSFQKISGDIAELCAVRELERQGLVQRTHFLRSIEDTDLIVYSPNVDVSKNRHRIEVKNVKTRERAVRSLAYDGDSLFGFFNDSREFPPDVVREFDSILEKNSGFCYMPPDTLDALEYKGKRFKPNTSFGKDMASFVKSGKIS